MFWVMLCTNFWFQYDSFNSALIDMKKYSATVKELGCEYPKAATKEDVEYYLSHDFAPFLTLNFEAWQSDDELEGKEKENESTSLQKGHCSYSFVRTGPKSLKMLTKCNKE